MPARFSPDPSVSIVHNLGLYRLAGFSGRREQLIQLHRWLVDESDQPAMAIAGDQGMGKSTLATAVAWNNIHNFSDGVIWVGSAGTDRFRLYDIVRTMDTLLGTTLTRISEDRWGIAILEQLYRRKRLLILDELSGATDREIRTLAEIVGHLHESGGRSRVMLIERDLHPEIAELVQDRHLSLQGLQPDEVVEFIQRKAPAAAQDMLHQVIPELHHYTAGRPLSLRLVTGLMPDLFSWPELCDFLDELPQGQDEAVDVTSLAAFTVESFAAFWPQAGPLLDRLARAAGGASLEAVRELFWSDLGTAAELDETLQALIQRGLVEEDDFRQRILFQPVMRRYLIQGAVMLGEDWDRRYATYYYRWLRRYEETPLSLWPSVDLEWGNIHQGADWCAERVERIWQQDALDLVREPLENREEPLAIPVEQMGIKDDLRLARRYALSMAHYAFWRHPPGILRWLAAGAVAANALGDVRNFAWLLANIGRQIFFKGEVELAVGWLKRVLVLFDVYDLLAELAYVHTDLGTSMRVLDEPRQALDHFWAAFEAVAQLGDAQSLATTFINLGSAHYSMHNHEKAVEQHRKALRIAMRLSDVHLIASAYNNLGLALEGMERFDQAQTAYELALQGFEQIDDLVGVSTCYNNLGSVCYARQDFDLALTWYERDLVISQERGAWVDMAATLHNLGHVAMEQGHVEQAQLYFQRSRDLYSAFRLTEYVQEEEEMLEYVHSLAQSSRA
jgi:tetratricopeptide (TPR) repeat protein